MSNIEYGQHYECASDTIITRDNLENYDDLEEAVFEYANFQDDYYDDDALADYPFGGKVTGIVIFGGQLNKRRILCSH